MRAGPAARRAASGGFTLVETLVALGIFAMIATAGMAMTRFVLAGTGDQGGRQDRAAELQLARAILRADLMHAVPRPARDAAGAPRPFTGGLSGREGPVLAFARGGWDNPGALEDRGPLLHVAYVLEGGRLLRRATLRPDATPQTPTVETELLTGVERLELRFLSRGVWTDAWGAASAAAGSPAAGSPAAGSPADGGRAPRLPDAVALELDLAGFGRVRQLLLTAEGAR